jgi:hypothetical protein
MDTKSPRRDPWISATDDTRRPDSGAIHVVETTDGVETLALYYTPGDEWISWSDGSLRVPIEVARWREQPEPNKDATFVLGIPR